VRAARAYRDAQGGRGGTPVGALLAAGRVLAWGAARVAAAAAARVCAWRRPRPPSRVGWVVGACLGWSGVAWAARAVLGAVAWADRVGARVAADGGGGGGAAAAAPDAGGGKRPPARRGSPVSVRGACSAASPAAGAAPPVAAATGPPPPSVGAVGGAAAAAATAAAVAGAPLHADDAGVDDGGHLAALLAKYEGPDAERAWAPL